MSGRLAGHVIHVKHRGSTRSTTPQKIFKYVFLLYIATFSNPLVWQVDGTADRFKPERNQVSYTQRYMQTTAISLHCKTPAVITQIKGSNGYTDRTTTQCIKFGLLY